MPFRIAVVQMQTVPGAVEANRARALDFAGEALEQRADVVLFHEGLLVGYHEHYRDLAEPADGATSRAFSELIAGSDARVLYGLTEREGDDFYLSAVLVGRGGVEAVYRKTHLWWKSDGLRHEPSYYRAGDSLVTFDLQGHKSGVMICYDGDFPEVARSYAACGCRMLFWLNNRQSRAHEEVRDLARRNCLIIASACCCGVNERGEDCPGGSNITDMDGTLLGELRDEEGLVIADVEPERADAARLANPWFTGRRPDLYAQ
jgi:predicted amidohydrolase